MKKSILSYGNALKVNKDLKLNIDEQPDDIKYLKGQCDIDDKLKTKCKKSQLLETP